MKEMRVGDLGRRWGPMMVINDLEESGSGLDVPCGFARMGDQRHRQVEDLSGCDQSAPEPNVASRRRPLVGGRW